jgi:hypothetical protein
MAISIILASVVACLVVVVVYTFYKILVMVEIVDDRLRSVERTVSFTYNDLKNLARKSAEGDLNQK